MNIQEKAMGLHQQGFNCAQSVICAVCDQIGLDARTAKAISGGFGGGLRCGEVCGAVSGAIMAMGMVCPYVDATDTAARDHLAELAKEVTGRFRAEYNCLRCADLIQAAGGRRRCGEFIGFCAALAEEIIVREQQA